MAPYHHFANKSALVAAVATRGFERLREAMLARAAREARRLLKLRALGVAYAVFAVRHPEVFRVMFGPELADPRDHPALAEAASRTMEALVAGFGGASDAGEIGPVRAERAALTSWAAMHGLATLVISGQLGPVTEANAVKLALMVTDGLRAGLGPSSTAGPPA
jgi:AcrR family transcriptional regulator